MYKKLTLIILVTGLLAYMSSCYNNREDILDLPKISFRGEVVPIVTAGPCGCHNMGDPAFVQFSQYLPAQQKDTIYYDAILARVGKLETWVNGGTHPGGGVIDLTANEKAIIRAWIQQGAKDDAASCVITGTVTFTTNIQPIYNTTCKGANCHGGLGVNLDYAKMSASESILNTIMNSGGSSGHPGGRLSLSSCTIDIFKKWIQQGKQQ